MMPMIRKTSASSSSSLSPTVSPEDASGVLPVGGLSDLARCLWEDGADFVWMDTARTTDEHQLSRLVWSPAGNRFVLTADELTTTEDQRSHRWSGAQTGSGRRNDNGQGGGRCGPWERALAAGIGAASPTPREDSGGHSGSATRECPTGAEDTAPVGAARAWAGWLGYELWHADAADRWGHTAPRHPAEEPPMAFVRADVVITLDHLTGEVTVDAATLEDRAAVRVLVDRARESHAAEVTNADGGAAGAATDTAAGAAADAAAANYPDRATYEERVDAIRETLRAGTAYEVCLTAAVTAPSPADPFATYLRLREVNPAPYAALARIATTTVLSSSPECFLRIEKGMATSMPIKGTTPRGATPVEDARRARWLAEDEKTRAENLMIVDLVRNDLGRVCTPGTVRVPELFGVKSYATVHQLVSTITGRPAPGVSTLEVIRSCFPPGSMTGAPKDAALRIADGLEDGPRGVYSGVLGMIGAEGTADLSVVIRAAVLTGERARIGAGGAVVVDSDPAAEYEEMTMKARSVEQAFMGEADVTSAAWSSGREPGVR